MIHVKSAIRKGLSVGFGEERGRAVTLAVGERARQVNYDLTPIGRTSKRRLQAINAAYSGKRCIIIGNGPSLRNTDLSLIRDEFTIGLNRIYLNFPNMGYRTSCLVCVNRNVTEQWGRDFNQLDIPKYFGWASRKHVEWDDKTAFIRSVRTPMFSTDIPSKGVWQGATVTYVAMQLAFYMGFTEVVLIGVDHSFSTAGPPHKLVTSTADDPNHFHPQYFGAGARWQLPDLETSERAYRLARKEFERDNRQIIDATIGGKLSVFPKVEYHTYFRR